MTNLQRIRKERGLSQADLSNASSVSLRTIQDYEQGQKPINKAAAITVHRIATVLGVKIEDLLED